MESIKLKNSIIHYYGSPSGYLKDDKATVDTMFECEELKDWCKNRQYAVTFADGIFDRLARKENLLDSQENELLLQNVRIWQLKADSDFSMRFISFDEFKKQFGEPSKDSYEVIYDGNLSTNNLDEIYEICNINHPAGYHGHSLSMSDIVELYDEKVSTFHYVDRFGFQKFNFESTEQTNSFDMKIEL